MYDHSSDIVYHNACCCQADASACVHVSRAPRALLCGTTSNTHSKTLPVCLCASLCVRCMYVWIAGHTSCLTKSSEQGHSTAQHSTAQHSTQQNIHHYPHAYKHNACECRRADVHECGCICICAHLNLQHTSCLVG